MVVHTINVPWPGSSQLSFQCLIHASWEGLHEDGAIQDLHSLVFYLQLHVQLKNQDLGSCQ